MRMYGIAAVALAIGCKQHESPPAPAPAPPAATPPRTPPPPPPAPPPAATFDDAALDAALAARGVKQDAVQQRSLGAHSAWALVEAHRDAKDHVVEYDLVRVDARGAAVLPFAPTVRKGPTWWDADTTPLDVQDLDGDGTDECVFALTWRQSAEAARQMYVVGGAAPAVAATAILDYSTPSEHVEFHYEIRGKTLVLTRTANQLNATRPANLTDPATDPLMAGGAIPIRL